MGYLTAYFMQTILIYNAATSAICQLGFLTGSCEILITFASDLQAELIKISRISECKTEREQLKLTQKFYEFIQFHSDVKW